MNDAGTARNLAYIYTVIFAAVLTAQFAFAWFQVDLGEGVQRLLDITLGVLFAMVLASKDYFLGSSAGSARKTEMLKPKNE